MPFSIRKPGGWAGNPDLPRLSSLIWTVTTPAARPHGAITPSLARAGGGERGTGRARAGHRTGGSTASGGQGDARSGRAANLSGGAASQRRPGPELLDLGREREHGPFRRRPAPRSGGRAGNRGQTRRGKAAGSQARFHGVVCGQVQLGPGAAISSRTARTARVRRWCSRSSAAARRSRRRGGPPPGALRRALPACARPTAGPAPAAPRAAAAWPRRRTGPGSARRPGGRRRSTTAAPTSPGAR